MPASELLHTCSNVLKYHSLFYRNWSDEDRLKHLQWYADMGLILVAEDPARSPEGIQRDLSLCLLRFLPDVESHVRSYFSDPSGHIVYLDYVYKGSNAGYLAMFFEGFKRWGTGKTHMAWHREDEPEDKIHIVPVRFAFKFCKKLC